MRKVYSKEQFQLAWGYDHAFGLFVQIFDTSITDDDDLILDCDQGMFSVGTKNYLTRSKIINVFDKYDFPKAKEEYFHFEAQEFEETYVGYIYNEDGMHDGKTYIKTMKDYQEFIEKAQQESKKIEITDIMDQMVYKTT